MSLLQAVINCMIYTCCLKLVDLSFFQALVSLSAKANVEALKERILAVCHAGEANGTTGQNGDFMETESAVVRESKEPEATTIAVPRFKLRLTVSILLDF